MFDVDSGQLSLFDVGGVDLVRLRRLREDLMVVPRAKNTLEAYRSDWRQFEAWCADGGRSSLPATPETVGLYLTWLLLDRKLKVSSATQHASAVAHFHRAAHHSSPIDADVRKVLSSVRRSRRERPKGKAALSPTDLARISRACDAGTARGARNRALLVLGFATGLRRSELARLNLSDVSFEKRGLAVVVRYSKTDQDGRGRMISVWAGKRSYTDPVRVLRAWISKRGRWDGSLFCRIQTGDKLVCAGITPEAVNEVVKHAVQIVGLDPAIYGAHSLRAGAVTASAELGRSDQEIMCLSGHSSASVMRGYIRSARLFAGRNPLAGAL